MFKRLYKQEWKVEHLFVYSDYKLGTLHADKKRV